MTVVPAYGRDYRSGDDAKRAFLDGKDFMIRGLPRDGAYVSRRDLKSGDTVQIRYAEEQEHSR